MTNKEPQRQLHYPTVFPVGGFLVQKGNYLTCLNGLSTIMQLSLHLHQRIRSTVLEAIHNSFQFLKITITIKTNNIPPTPQRSAVVYRNPNLKSFKRLKV